MRQLASFLLIALVLPATAADTWRWKDANGVTHYSDRPVPGAERMNLGTAGPASDSMPAAPRAPAVPAPQAVTSVPYLSCVVISPASDEVFNNVNAVNATLQVTPNLQTGHRLRVLLNGRAYAEWPDQVLSYTLINMARGSYTLSVQVLDAEGRSLCAGPTSTFHVRQPSILSPARQGAAQGAARP